MVRGKPGTLRVIGGWHRGRRLIVPAGRGTRPPLDRQRETIFNVLGPRVHDAAVADLFAGSGSFGIEALSRGARSAWFVERDPAALAALAENLRALGLEPVSRVSRGDAFRIAGQGPDPIDVAFVDPPFPAIASAGAPLAMRGMLEDLTARFADPAVIVLRTPPASPAPRPPDRCIRADVRDLGRSRVHFWYLSSQPEAPTPGARHP
jgi:16S rRNA (guanine966-N2)-methyltransferase